MEAILHFLGICPDSVTHSNIANLIICYYGEFQHIVNLVKTKIGL